MPTVAHIVNTHEDTMTDAALCHLLREGQRDAFEYIVNRHRRLVYWSAYTVVGLHADAEELTADTFLTLWGKRREFVLAGESLAPWLATTARYLGKNRLRASRRREADALDDQHETGYADFEQGVDLRLALDSAISRLSETDRAIFRLCLEEELSYEAAAQALGITTGSVRNRLSRLRTNLQKTLHSTLTERSDS